ncbi:hypothetical protein Tco_1107568 [Tanacetum coccineum]
MDLETVQTNLLLAKLPLLTQGEYEFGRKLRIEQYFQVQEYALWDGIENGNSFKPAAQTTTNADGSSTTLIPGPYKDAKTFVAAKTNKIWEALEDYNSYTQVSTASYLKSLRIEFNKSEFNLATYKRGLASVEEQLVFYKKNETVEESVSTALVASMPVSMLVWFKRRRAVSTGSGRISTASTLVSTAKNHCIKERGKGKRRNLRARVEADEELSRRLQTEERNKYSEVDQAKMLIELIN